MIATYLPYILFGIAGAGVIALIGAWMAWCDLIDSANSWIAKMDDAPCDNSPSANETFSSKWWT